MFNKLKHVKDLRDQAKQMQNMLGEEKVETTSSSGKIKITMTGNQEIENISIDQELLGPENKENLQNELKSTFNKSIKDVQKLMAEKIRQSGDINLPGM